MPRAGQKAVVILSCPLSFPVSADAAAHTFMQSDWLSPWEVSH